MRSQQNEAGREPYPEQYELKHEFELKQARLARFLLGRDPSRSEPDFMSDEYTAALRKARVMLCAEELLEAAEYSWTLLGGLSTPQFTASGDSPARDVLLNAITNAIDGGYDSNALRTRCAEDVRRAILTHQSMG